ncbi:transcription elongation factor-like protein [Leishmania major strain Friedlin]|uniref:Transcription elongation factor-like protein n=1 Tax=Leishmania major TaxID=5664 RepID=Q4QAW1_LEIMA|nr:transcription elongation factor-like protein [Leishmania major strain Friedlin]CAG9574486.1 transcription_elongation_factor-like_protein [Leishmania major strain Friedlin]CAJ04024.1 transcription elongation factor-like protein [Leishmania major strain Friedlin]|eukprot:XP_001683537.1 transcription elongation factor-like protein [Leishmania major strain Friedlin]
MSDSEWSSDSGVSNAEAIAAASLNKHLGELMTLQHPSRVTHRRPAYATSEGTTASSATISHTPRVSGEAPRKQARMDISSLIRQALSQSSAHCTSANVDEVAGRVVAALRQKAGGAEVARAVTRALADPLNEELRESVLSGLLRPEELVALDEVSLLNQAERSVLAKARRERLNQHSVEYLERLNLTVTNMLTCPECRSHECYANFRFTDFVKWQGDDQTPTLQRCCRCSVSFCNERGKRAASAPGACLCAWVAVKVLSATTASRPCIHPSSNRHRTARRGSTRETGKISRFSSCRTRHHFCQKR